MENLTILLLMAIALVVVCAVGIKFVRQLRTTRAYHRYEEQDRKDKEADFPD
jgi:hypothetical protein